MKDIVRRYIEGLEQAYLNNGGEEKWNEFVNDYTFWVQP